MFANSPPYGDTDGYASMTFSVIDRNGNAGLGARYRTRSSNQPVADNSKWKGSKRLNSSCRPARTSVVSCSPAGRG